MPKRNFILISWKTTKSKMHFLGILLLISIVGMVLVSCAQQTQTDKTPPIKTEITNFEECAAAGNPIMESMPRQCKADGETFVEEIDEEPLNCDPGPCVIDSWSLEDMFSKIDTKAGELTLKYEIEQATLSGTLQRPTPCVNWAVKTTSTKDLPISNVNIDIFNSNKGAICIQVLGEPQEIKETILQVSENTEYTIKFEDEVVFSGKIFPDKLKQ